ncbi:hypothetical protein [Microbacterium album]|uniref:Uncharacterized protein n=1 Tax=Microbacterium album TaxID=2053191 RepID=A0A917MPF5_9MICO|nr:hypothetical protein [Microbacterium album]GGH47142.1 hypothetical protein GCM10010921_23680 [Microbacterium album]
MARRDLDLIRTVDEALRGDAFDLLVYASRVLEMLRRPLDPNGEPIEGMPTLAEMVESTLADAVRQSDALLLAMAVLLDGGGTADDAVAERIRSSAGDRWRTLPGWLSGSASRQPGAEIAGVIAFEHVLGADATILIGAVLPDGTPITATVFIDRDGGGTIGDAFVTPETLDAALAAGARGVDAEEFPRVEIAPADARERVARAMVTDLALEPALVTDSWPACRPLLAWLLRSLPDGGGDFPRPPAESSTDDALIAAVRETVPDGEQHARLLIALNREHSGAGDARLWSDTFVESLLLDLLPFEDDAEADPEGVLAALRALIVAGHVRAEVPERLTLRTLEAVDELADSFLELLAIDEDPYGDGFFDDLGDGAPDGGASEGDAARRELALLALRVGGHRHLDALDTVPMTRVVRDHRALDERARTGLATVRGLIERACGTLFEDPELATAATSVADLLVDADPRIFAKGKPELAAAAVIWIAATVNDALAPAGDVPVSAVMSALGLRGSTPAARAVGYLAVLDVDEPDLWSGLPSLGDPSLLTAGTRRELIRRRDEARARL